MMRGWDGDELRKIAEAYDLHVSPFRADRTTYGTPTWIWSVAVDGGQESKWYRAAVRQKAGRILAAGLTKEVTFEPVGGAVLDSIDDAYRAKYRGRRYLDPMIGARVRSATLRIIPIDGNRS
jgi:hypothetical protein